MTKTVVVTGANSGIGLATAHELAARECKVVLACRNQGRAEQARAEILARTPGADLEIALLDLASLDDVRRFAEGYDRVDALVNNAGLSVNREQHTADGFELEFGVNYLAHFLLTHLVPADTVVHLSSVMHLLGRIDPDSFRGRRFYNPLTTYGQSKLANLMFNFALARRGVTTHALHPGGVDTAVYRELPRIVNAAMRIALIGPEKPGKLIADLATDPKRQQVSGDYHSLQTPPIVSPYAKSVDRQEDLYARSCELVGVKPLT